MNLDPGVLFASFVVSSVGFVLFAYGKKQQRFPQMLIGVAMMGFPYFVPGVGLMLGIGAALVGVLMVMIRFGM